MVLVVFWVAIRYCFVKIIYILITIAPHSFMVNCYFGTPQWAKDVVPFCPYVNVTVYNPQEASNLCQSQEKLALSVTQGVHVHHVICT